MISLHNVFLRPRRLQREGWKIESLRGSLSPTHAWAKLRLPQKKQKSFFSWSLNWRLEPPVIIICCDGEVKWMAHLKISVTDRKQALNCKENIRMHYSWSASSSSALIVILAIVLISSDQHMEVTHIVWSKLWNEWENVFEPYFWEMQNSPKIIWS